MRNLIRASLIGLASLSLPAIVAAQALPHPPALPPPSLKTVPVPEPEDLGRFVKDKSAAIALGKALFWDMQTGGDGIVACASCHFQAGADSRTQNQLNPGLIAGDLNFDVGGPNHALLAGDYPFHKLSNPEDRDSDVIRSHNDVTGSAGVFNTNFVDILLGKAADKNTVSPDPLGFQLSSLNVRRVTGRNTPSAINAVFNVRQFWDGRANNRFNGVNPFGDDDTNARVIEVLAGDNPIPVHISLQDASLASQACGPPLSDFEMSGAGRTFPKLGKKLLSLRPLAKQAVHPDDSMLGPYAKIGGKGLTTTYANLIQAAFHDKWWNSAKKLDGNLNLVTPANTTNQFTVMEANFSLFWGLAVQCYEATLVSDDAPYDRFAEGDATAMNAQQQYGFKMFMGDPLTGTGANCIVCHVGAEFTGASYTARLHDANEGLVERMIMGDKSPALYDGGFYNIGVRPTEEDPGIGGTDPFGNPLSRSRRAQLFGQENVERVTVFPPVDPDERIAVDGAFKTPSLRNTELTGPYFHNGSYSNLLSVVQFYTRGGNFHEHNIDNLDPDVNRLRDVIGHPDRQFALTAFITALTDDRVRYYRAPFDHPELILPAGQSGDDLGTIAGAIAGQAKDKTLTLKATGRAGQTTPLKSFLGVAHVDATIPAPSPVFSNMAFLANETIHIASHKDTQGDMFANGDIDFDGGTSRFHDGDLTTGGNLYLHDGNVIFGNVTSKKSILAGTGSAVVHFAAQNALFAKAILPALSFTAGGAKVTLEEFAAADLLPGTYGDLILKKGSTLSLAEGEYFFTSIWMGGGARLQYEQGGPPDFAGFDPELSLAPTEKTIVNVTGDVWLGQGAEITSGDELKSDHFRLNILSDPTVKITRDNLLHCTIMAPSSLVNIGPDTWMRGSVFARNIDVAPGVQFAHHHANLVAPIGKVRTRIIPTEPDPTPEPVVESTAPMTFTLAQNSPNPFNPTTTIRFALPETRDVQLHVYGVDGRLVRTLASGPMGAGHHILSWDGTDEGGNHIASGVYLYKLIAGNDSDQKKMILLK